MNLKIPMTMPMAFHDGKELWVKYDPPTADLIAELEKRRPCNDGGCMGVHSPHGDGCRECRWSFHKDNFKPYK
jgi:hypothetical protein